MIGVMLPGTKLSIQLLITNSHEVTVRMLQLTVGYNTYVTSTNYQQTITYVIDL